jgi:hypothetical protein
MVRKSRKAPRRIPEHAATMRGLYGWYQAMFEKLGWMVLAKAKGQDSKVAEYKHGINLLFESTKHVMSEYDDHNRIHDLNVLHMHTLVLRDFVNANL